MFGIIYTIKEKRQQFPWRKHTEIKGEYNESVGNKVGQKRRQTE